ncbi:hypothetical protein ASPZODRAFT_89582 [Penicilliopsis zonata CBS 506.65]|uniref:Copper-fist domain-containing protein n=1 Tax=Penicilliopsis zonata CBS 506.65 TaxID=1073090 RepID=A0A1L9SS28_9EURO|nr:hypothetical protein ASPZODRAFT_89582 [Penicilliopsis zonata CBS 506.65]OJJ49934.1 hypothetical protein ASPZODRAFT_89582 [Penicilliopsis zonata CBS 506.65]
MPLDEEGAKWSCEPCIRGHRSSKCQHFDRMMMKVPKAGRPLAKCPHPKGNCSCQKLYAFMVRIPKGSTCLCRPVYQVPSGMSESGFSTPSASAAPGSSPAPSGRIQKPSRRQSNLHVAPENIERALNSLPKVDRHLIKNESLSHIPANNHSSPKEYSDTSSPRSPPAVFNLQRSLPPVEEKVSAAGGCCSNKPQPPKLSPKSGSCCGQSKAKPGIKPSESTIPAHSKPNSTIDVARAPPSSTHATDYSLWQGIGSAGQGPHNLSYAQQVNPFQSPVYMNEYGLSPAPASFLGPLSSEFRQAGGNHNHGYIDSVQPGHYQGTDNQPILDADTIHDCSCGDDCQCLGCASHPFNHTTRQHVQEMGFIVTLDGQVEGSLRSNGLQTVSSPFPGENSTAVLNNSLPHFDHILNTTPLPDNIAMYSEHFPSSGFNSSFPSPPAEYASGQQMMEPSEYYTIAYPVGLPSTCSDVTGSCQCGNDCTCLGCLTHSGHSGLTTEGGFPGHTSLSHL